MKKDQTTHDMRRHARQASSLLKNIANPQRLLILCTLVNGEKCVSDIIIQINISQSATSQHLARMRQAGIVAYEKRGQKIFYRLASAEVRALLSTLYLIYCAPR